MRQDALDWQVAIWDTLSQTYASETDRLFAPLVRRTVDLADPDSGEALLDLGCGTGSVALEAASRVAPTGFVLGVDPSPRMLEQATERGVRAGLENVRFAHGAAEDIPADSDAFDVAVASLSLMYVIDRGAAAAELARVLRRGGRFVAIVWSDAEHADIVRFQETVGRFGPVPLVEGVGPGSLSDPAAFVDQLEKAGINATVERESSMFEVADFDVAWRVMAEVTASRMEPQRRDEAMSAVRELMWPDGDGPRTFINDVVVIAGRRI